MIKKSIEKSFGFTLIEVLIAISIFAIVSVIATQALQNSVITKNILMKKVNRLNQVKMSYQIMERDLINLINRPITDADGKKQPALLVPINHMSKIGLQVSSANEFGIERLEFTRSGHTQWLLNEDSSLQRIAYYLNGDQLVRHSWRVLDQAPSSKADVRVLLDKIKKIEIKFYDQKGNLLQEWDMDSCIPTQKEPCENKKISLPAGIVVVISLEDLGDLAWVFVN